MGRAAARAGPRAGDGTRRPVPLEGSGGPPERPERPLARAAGARILPPVTHMKIGRNEPCPCGSGRKYKKCCLPKDEAEALGAIEGTGRPEALDAEPLPFRTPAPDLPPMSPYVVAKLVEDSEELKRSGRRDSLGREIVLPGTVARLRTDEICRRLTALGVDPSPARFLELAAGRTSAWDVSDVWRREIGRKLPKPDADFIGLAACELWKRYCPERPSVEMLDDWMEEGYAHFEHDDREACRIWWKVWEVLRPRLTPAMRTTAAARAVFDGSQCLFNWTQDFSLAFQNASRDGEKEQAELGIRYLSELIAQFRDEDGHYLVNVRADLGELYFRAGRGAEGERVVRDLVRDFPDEATGYVRLADALLERGEPGDAAEALSVLDAAKARPVEDLAGWDLDPRIDALRRRLENPAGRLGGMSATGSL